MLSVKDYSFVWVVEIWHKHLSLYTVFPSLQRNPRNDSPVIGTCVIFMLNHRKRIHILSSACTWAEMCLSFFKIFLYLFSCFRPCLQHTGYSLHHAGSPTVVRRLSSCGPAQVLHGMGILVAPPRIEPVSPASHGRFLTTGPPGKALSFFRFGLRL